MSETPLIQISNLGKSFNGGDPVIRNLSLEMCEGQFLALTGASGIGKTLLLRIVSGLERPTEGEVLYRCRRIISPDPDFAFVFQDYRNSLFLWKTALQNVMLALDGANKRRLPTNEKKAIAVQYLREVGLEEYQNYYPYQLSGGQQQRTCFARALAQSPRCLFLDEPFGSVDHLTKLELEDLLLSLYARHKFTCVMVTHDLDEASYVASRIIVFSRPYLSVEADLSVNLPYPRSQATTRFECEFENTRAQLYRLFAERRNAR